MILRSLSKSAIVVVPFTGHVDGNSTMDALPSSEFVVPFTGHVDGNGYIKGGATVEYVVPFTGHVDGNTSASSFSAIRCRRALHGARGLK